MASTDRLICLYRPKLMAICTPTTMSVEKGGKKLKNDMRDARQIAKCMCDGSYRAVYIPNEEDDAVKEFIRMRDDIKQNLKSIKQQIVALQGMAL